MAARRSLRRVGRPLTLRTASADSRHRENDEDVAWMRIGVKVAVDRDLLQIRARELLGERAEVVLESRERRDVGELRPRIRSVVSTRSVEYRSITRGTRILGKSASERRNIATLRASIR